MKTPHINTDTTRLRTDQSDLSVDYLFDTIMRMLIYPLGPLILQNVEPGLWPNQGIAGSASNRNEISFPCCIMRPFAKRKCWEEYSIFITKLLMKLNYWSNLEVTLHVSMIFSQVRDCFQVSKNVAKCSRICTLKVIKFSFAVRSKSFKFGNKKYMEIDE